MMHSMMTGMVIWWIVGVMLIVTLIIVIARLLKR